LLLSIVYSPSCLLWWWAALALSACAYSIFWWLQVLDACPLSPQQLTSPPALHLQRRILATSSQRCQVFSKAPHPQTLFALVRSGGIPVLHEQLRLQLQVPSSDTTHKPETSNNLQRTGSLKRRLRCAFVIGHGGGGHLTAMNAIKVQHSVIVIVIIIIISSSSSRKRILSHYCRR
jgi:hypothetical protein